MTDFILKKTDYINKLLEITRLHAKKLTVKQLKELIDKHA